MSSHFSFPSPFGGVPFESDFAPSVLFAIVYTVLVAVVLWRLISHRSRTFVLLNTIPFAIERVVIFGLRANEAKVPSTRTSEGLITYMQTTLTVGFISIATDLLFLLRCLTTTATLPDARTMGTNIPLVESPEPGLQPLHSGELQPRTVLQDAISERAKERKGYRDINGLLQLFYFVPMILGTVVSVLYIKTENDESKVKLVRQLRYATGATSCVFVSCVQIFAIYAAIAIRGIKKRPAWLIFVLATLLNIVSIYRLAVGHFETTSLLSTAPGSLNTTQSKVTFYVLHILPEWVTSAILLSMNLREVFETGLWGDTFRPLEKDLLKDRSGVSA